MKTMTTREIAEVFGVDVTNVNRRVKSLFPELVKKGVTTRLSDVQVAQLSASFKQNGQLCTPSANHNLGTSTQVNPGTIMTDIEKLAVIAQASIYIQELYQDALARCDALQLELDKSKEYATVKRMQSLNDCSFDWRALKDYSIENGYEIKKVFDQNYGEVNAYHKDVWLAVYGEQCDEVPWND